MGATPNRRAAARAGPRSCRGRRGDSRNASGFATPATHSQRQRLHVRHTDDWLREPRFLAKLPQSPITNDSQDPALGRVSHVASVFNQIEHLVECVHMVNRGPHDAKPLGRLAIVQPAPAVAFNDWDIVALASVHFQFARRRICRVLAFSSFAETASARQRPRQPWRLVTVCDTRRRGPRAAPPSYQQSSSRRESDRGHPVRRRAP